MSVNSEDLMIHEIEQEHNEEKSCMVSNKGITIYGFTLSWIVVALIVVGVFLYLNKNNFLAQSVKNVVSEPTTTVMTGGFIPELKKLNFDLPAPGQMRRMYGH